MRIFNLIGEGFHALRSFIITKESAMTDTSIINSTTPAGDAELPQFAIPDANVPTDPQLQRLSSPSTVAPATSEETPGETHVAPDATAQHTPSPSGDQNAVPDASASPAAVKDAATVQPAEQSATPDAAVAQSADQAATPDAAAAQPADQAATPEAAAAPQPAEQSVPLDAPAQPVDQPAAADPAADAQPQAQTPVADAAAEQASAQAVNAAVQETAPVADSGSATSAAPSSAQPAGEEEQSDFSAGVKDFGAAFDFVQQGIEHLGMAARKELFELARKYL